MQLHDWLETAYTEGRISIAEALNVQRNGNPDWHILIAQKRIPFASARKIIALTLDRRISLSAALDVVISPGKTKKPSAFKKAVASRTPPSRHQTSTFVQDALNYLDRVKEAECRSPIEQISFFIESWEMTYVRDRSLISGDRAEQLRDLVRAARSQARTDDDYVLIRRAELVVTAIRERGLMPSNYNPRPILIPIGGQPKRRG